MKNTKNYFLCIIAITFISLIFLGQIIAVQHVISNEEYIQNEHEAPFNDGLKTSSDLENYQIIEDIFSQKLSDYSNLGYFRQTYESSIQATYYALYILNALGRLDQVNQTEIESYIMAQYDAPSNIFIDENAYRYLNADQSGFHYPLSSLLQINCYAILSLDILGRLDLINTQNLMDFIWTCYNPITSGFIGQPYDTDLDSSFNISTMDNTFYAVQALFALMGGWGGYSDERNEIIAFINGLQYPDGSFKNDEDPMFQSLLPQERSMLTAYYNIKTLDAFGMVSTVDVANFNLYLDDNYISPGEHPSIIEDDFFVFYSTWDVINQSNLIATAVGLELSQITGFTGCNEQEAVQFLKNHRNALGNWDSSTPSQHHELIDSFQIIRCLSESGNIDQLSSQEKNEIASAISLYQQVEGFSLLSEDYMSTNLIYTIVRSFELYDRISDLDIQWLYLNLENSYVNELGFLGCVNMDEYVRRFRSYPFEYYNLDYRSDKIELKWLYSHEYTYQALYSLLKTFKLDDFETNFDLSDIIDDIIESQFLEPGYENFGGFLPSKKIAPNQKNQSIILDNSYYAIKTLELLTSYLDSGSILNLTFNKGALYGYIQSHIVELASTIHFDPRYTSNVETVLMNTYQMIYLLKALDLYDLNDLKIEEFVRQNINYDNLKNIYYSFKISEILGGFIDFDYVQTRASINNLYSEKLREFYLTSDFQDIEQEAFLWVCDMAKNDKLTIEYNYTDCLYLGSVNTITATLNNIVFDKFGADYVVKFESPQFGSVNLEKQYDNLYVLNFMVLKDLDYYPCVDGFLNVYDRGEIISQVPIFFITLYEFELNHEYSNVNGLIYFEVNVSRKFASKYEPLLDSWVEVKIFTNNSFLKSINSSREDFVDHSRFTFSYECEYDAYYYFDVSFFDIFHPQGLFLFPIEQYPPPPPFTLEVDGTFLGFGGLTIASLAGVSTVKVGEKIKRKKKSKDKVKGSKSVRDIKQENILSPHKTQLKNSLFDDWGDEKEYV